MAERTFRRTTPAFSRAKKCYFTQNRDKKIDYKDIELLKGYIGDSGKIVPTIFTGTRQYYQRKPHQGD